MKILLLYFLLFSSVSYGFVRTRTTYGDKIKWDDSSITIYISPANTDGLSDTNVVTTAVNSISQWNNSGNITVAAVQSNVGQVAGRNDIYFAQNSIFGLGVLAVTSVSYEGSSGKIVEADIIVNDMSYNYSTTQGSTDNINHAQIFLGDVLTHEMGHVLGLGHGQVKDSSMIYTIYNGQYSTSEDDKNGVNSAYPATSQGSISGKIVGSSNLVGVFGAHVITISTSTGKIISGIFTNDNGDFSIENLPLDDTYYIYVAPMNTSASVPSYYHSARNNFCDGRSSYRGTFFTSCDSREEGYPQGIKLTASTAQIDVGNVTIKCVFDVPYDYLDYKNSRDTQSYFDLDVVHDSSIGNAMTGYFAPNDESSELQENIRIDLSSVPPASDTYLDLKMVSQALFSTARSTVVVSRGDGLSLSYGIGLDSDGNPDLNYVMRVPLSLTSSDNVFTVQITARDRGAYGGYYEEDIMPQGVVGDPLAFYLLIATLSEKNSGVYSVVNSRDYGTPLGNDLCTQAENTYSVSAFVTTQDLFSGNKKDKKNQQIIACGSIGSDGPGSGPFNMLLGFIFVIIVSQISLLFGRPDHT